MSALVPVLAAVCVLAGVAVAVSAGLAGRRRRLRDLDAALELIALEPSGGQEPRQLSALFARSGAFAEQLLAPRTSWLGRVSAELARSDWSLGTGEFVVVSAAGALLTGVVLGLAAGLIPALVGVAVGLPVPYLLVRSSVRRRRARFEARFPDVLDLLAAGLEAGASLQQGLELVVAEAGEPVATEFGRVLAATAIGATLTEALDGCAERLGSSDLAWTVQAIAVQQRTGGRLAEVLRIVAATMRDRFSVKRELAALTAEGRLSAYVLLALPFVLGGVITLLNPHYLSPLFHQTAGLVLIAGAAALMVVAGVLMSRIVRVEV